MEDFKGFIIQARGEGSNLLGSFTITDSDNSKLRECSGNAAATVSFLNHNDYYNYIDTLWR